MADSERLICSSSALLEGATGVRFTFERGGAVIPAFAVRYRGSVRAYANRCTHMQVELDWQQGEFFDESGLYLICATHGALYAPESGRCRGGPCSGRGLEPVSVYERGGNVFLLQSPSRNSS